MHEDKVEDVTPKEPPQHPSYGRDEDRDKVISIDVEDHLRLEGDDKSVLQLLDIEMDTGELEGDFKDVSLDVEDLLRLGGDDGTVPQLLHAGTGMGVREHEDDMECEGDGDWSMLAAVGDEAWDVGYLADFATDTKDHSAAWREARERASNSITMDARFRASLSSDPISSFAAIQARYADVSLCRLQMLCRCISGGRKYRSRSARCWSIPVAVRLWRSQLRRPRLHVSWSIGVKWRKRRKMSGS
jgi:hypothetical protein